MYLNALINKDTILRIWQGGGLLMHEESSVYINGLPIIKKQLYFSLIFTILHLGLKALHFPRRRPGKCGLLWHFSSTFWHMWDLWLV